jgi:predicted ABC-type transport system involved in lysophospholipase L1 biosynthesis ATPase subunit
VVFQGRSLYELSSARRTEVRATEIGFVFQSYHLLPELDVLENVMLPAMSRFGAMRAAPRLRQRAGELLERVGLGARAPHRPAELSGGEQQRAALARALMNDPDLILADEPTGNLDSETGDQVLAHLFALTRERGRTLVLVTHNEAVAGRCDRRLRLKDGCLA